VTFGDDDDAPADSTSLDDGVLRIEHPDGSLTIDLNPDVPKSDEGKDDFYANLAEKMEESDLAQIASDLLDGIQRDEQSRKEWLSTRAKGIALLGLNVNESAEEADAPIEGQCRIRHPLLLEATVRFQATARGELLPATGPVKVRNDQPPTPDMPPVPPASGPPMAPPPAPAPTPPMGPPGMAGAALPMPPQPPPTPAMGHNGGPPLHTPNESDELATALEKDMNHYLTVIATEYVPDTDRMLFYVGFGGDGFKKVYNCPLRQRPVSESVDAEDLIVSNAATDLQNCGRVTHQIKMRRSVLRRMQILGEYLDVDLQLPSPLPKTAVDQEKEAIAGQTSHVKRPEDEDYTVYECYCELDLAKFAPKDFKDKGLPLPYRVTLEKDSRKILSVKRNWKEDDDQCLPKQYFVQFPFIRGLGFYGYGFLHLLGNMTKTLTAAYREIIDAGMFASFPGFLHSKMAGRQLTNQFRVPPGGGVPVDIGGTDDIRKMIMPLPYKEAGPAFTAFIAHVEEAGSRLAQTADINVGEGKQDAPVGTTLALIEQATKTLDSAHKRLHAAQANEFQLLKERFREDPEAFWRHNKRPTLKWRKDQFIKALNDYDLVPVADPNNPTSLHRAAKAMAIKELQKTSPQLYDAMAVDKRIMRIMGVDPEGLFNATPAPPPPDPRFEAIKQKAQSTAQQVAAQQQAEMGRMQVQLAQLQDKASDRESREKIEQMKIMLEGIRLQEEKVIHQHEIVADHAKNMAGIQADHIKNTAEMQADQARAASELQMDRQARQHELVAGHIEKQNDLQSERQAHEQRMTHQQQVHEQKLQHERELNDAKVEHARKLATISKPTKE
jgi:hypothetical protein